MFKDKRVIIAGIIILAVIAVIIAIVTNGSQHTDNTSRQATSHKVAHHTKAHQTKPHAASSSAATTSSTTKDASNQFDAHKVLAETLGAPAVISQQIGATSAQIVLADDDKQDFDTYLANYSKAALALLTAADQHHLTDIYIARQVKLEDGTEYAVAGYWTHADIAKTAQLAADAKLSDVLTAASRYYIGGSVWGNLTQTEKNLYTNHQQGGQLADNQDFTDWVTKGIIKN